MNLDTAHRMMVELVKVALGTAAQLLRDGRREFESIAFAVDSQGGYLCFVAEEADFLPVLSAQPQQTEERTVEGTDNTLIETGPLCTTECLALEHNEHWEKWDHHDSLEDHLRELAVAGKIVASAIVFLEENSEEDDLQGTRIQVELEHATGWTMLASQPYRLGDESVEFEPLEQYDHEAFVFPTSP